MLIILITSHRTHLMSFVNQKFMDVRDIFGITVQCHAPAIVQMDVTLPQGSVMTAHQVTMDQIANKNVCQDLMVRTVVTHAAIIVTWTVYVTGLLDSVNQAVTQDGQESRVIKHAKQGSMDTTALINVEVIVSQKVSATGLQAIVKEVVNQGGQVKCVIKGALPAFMVQTAVNNAV